MTVDRPHLYRVLEDADGNPLRGASYSILSATGGAFNGSLFETNDGTAVFPASGTTETGVIDCYFGAPARIILQFTPTGSVQATAAVIDVEAPYTFGLPADLSVMNVPQAAGNVLTAIDADSASWQPATGGGGSTVDPDDPSTVPSVIYETDSTDAVWAITIDTDGALSTALYLGPVTDLTASDSSPAGTVTLTWMCPSFESNDTFNIDYANENYSNTPADSDYAHLTTVAPISSPQFTPGPTSTFTAEITVSYNDIGVLFLRVTHLRGSAPSAGVATSVANVEYDGQ